MFLMQALLVRIVCENLRRRSCSARRRFARRANDDVQASGWFRYFLNSKSLRLECQNGKVMLSVPFALVRGAWLLWLLGYNMSVAVAVGFIALAGVAAEIGVVMLIYLDHALFRDPAATPGRKPH